jgi:acetyltransferase
MGTLDNFFYPSSIAVVGASSKRETLSWELVNNLIKFGFEGKIFPVNPNSPAVHSIKAYKSIKDINDKVDLAILMVPKQFVLNAIDDCHKAKVDSVILITAGFKEVGGEGADLEKQLIEKIRKYKIRLVGPNCMGIINTNLKVKLNGTFVLGNPLPGGIGFVSQSGALGAAVLKTVQQNGIGLAQFLSIGNKADISGNAVLEYWKDNEDIKVITVYLESFGNPKRFMELTREISKTKPVIVIKSGRTAAGMKAASSHTGALASSDIVVDAFLEQSGVIRVNTIDEMFDLAKAFDMGNLPKGNRLGILTNAGGPAILAVDECDKVGLQIPELTEKTQAKLRAFVPPESSVFNPVDILPAANASMYETATRLMLQDKNIDSLIVILGPPLMMDTLEIACSIVKGAEGTDKTVMIVLMSQDDIIPKLRTRISDHPPVFRFPESAARAIGVMLNYKKWQQKPIGEYIKFNANKTKTRSILDKYKSKGEIYLDFMDVYELLVSYGLPIIETGFAKDVYSAVQEARTIGYPVVLKAVGKNLIHKTEAGGVIIDLHNDDEVHSAIATLNQKLRHKGIGVPDGYIIQPYIRGGVETIFGITTDAKAGHLIMFGLGGIMVEVFKDVKFKLLPVTDVEAEHLITSINSYKLLKGVRGKPPVDLGFIKENLLKLSQLGTDFPEITEVDFNPFVVTDKRSECKILDARIKVNIE